MGKNVKHIFMALVFLTLVGCGPKLYENTVNPAASDMELQRDYAGCRSYAEGNSPMPQMQPVPQATTTYGSGTVMTSTGKFVPYAYTATTTPNPYHTMSVGLNNVAAQFAYIARVERITEDCLTSLGWKEVKKSKKQEEVIEKEPIILSFIEPRESSHTQAVEKSGDLSPDEQQPVEHEKFLLQLQGSDN